MIQVKDASFYYKKGNNVFSNLNLHADEGEIIALLGANGSGKTTLIKCLLGFLRLRSGSVTVDGRNIGDIPAKEFWQTVGYVPQARGTYSSLDVRNMIMLGCASRIGAFSSPGERENEMCVSVSERLGISHLLNKKCSEISGGELQMVLIARALIVGPRILVFDEPESNLDFKNQLTVLETISSLKKDGKTVIISTHYPEHALSRADRSLVFCEGSAIFGDTSDVLTVENIRRAFGVDTLISETRDGDDIYRNIIPTRII